MSEYRKPDGEYTSDAEDYVEAWRAMIQPVIEATGLVLRSFDPDFGLQTPDFRRTVSLPAWFVKRLNRGLAGLLQEETQTATSNLDEWLKEAEKVLAIWSEHVKGETNHDSKRVLQSPSRETGRHS